MSTSTPANDSGRHEALREFPSNLSGAAGSPTAAAPARFAVDTPAQVQTGDYVVEFVNQTGDTVLSHFGIRFILTGSPEIQEAAAVNVDLEPGGLAGFTLTGLCSALEAYVVAAFIGPADNATLYHQIPKSGGVMTPERASQENPNDPGPCRDQLEFVFVPG